MGRVRVRKADYAPGAGESGGLGALPHKGVSVATGFVRGTNKRACDFHRAELERTELTDGR